MKRSGPLPRRTPLRSGKPLRRSGPPKRTPMPRGVGVRPGSAEARTRTPQQERRAAWEAEFRSARKQVIERADGRCERCGWMPVLWSSLHVHHKAGRRLPDANRLDLLAALCPPCHEHVHAHPAESYTDGWLIHWENAS